MSVSVDSGGGGRTKNLMADLNLVPFIDLLSVCITFLLATAVWTQIDIMKVDQAIAPPNDQTPPPDPPPPPPLTIHIRADGLWMGRKVEEGKNYPKTEDDYDWATMETDLTTDHTTYPDDTQAVIVTDDGVKYENMIHALDISRKVGYDKTLLGGGPAQNTSALPSAGGGGH